jgi:hypothetical protein
MNHHFKTLEQRIERESRDDYPGVLEKISDSWRLIVADLTGHREVELQFRSGGEWITYMKECVINLGLDLPEDFGVEEDPSKPEKPTAHLTLVR